MRSPAREKLREKLPTLEDHGAVVGTSAGSLAKGPLQERVRGLLGRFMNHLSSHGKARARK